mmetsp:Transcript_8637/g.24254  ORF Transcript_8637/g.24254 Transcript_8637/m.24254 type:complete len:141 (+) Transcript_8637:2456-2878(+)
MRFFHCQWTGLITATWIGPPFQMNPGHRCASPILCRGGTLVSEPRHTAGGTSDCDAAEDNACTGAIDSILDGPGSDLRIQADSIINNFEKELIRIRQEIVIEAEEEMLAICEAALEKRKAELHERHRLADIQSVLTYKQL